MKKSSNVQFYEITHETKGSLLFMSIGETSKTYSELIIDADVTYGHLQKRGMNPSFGEILVEKLNEHGFMPVKRITRAEREEALAQKKKQTPIDLEGDFNDDLDRLLSEILETID